MTESNYQLEYKSSNFEGKGCVPLEIGRWVCQLGENNTGVCVRAVIDKSINEFELCDAMYDVAEVDQDDEESPHYCAVLDALNPILTRQETRLSFTVDGISYDFQVTNRSE